MDFLEQVVLGEIRRLTRFASQLKDDFVKAVIRYSEQAVVAEKQRKQKGLISLVARDREIDNRSIKKRVVIQLSNAISPLGMRATLNLDITHF